MKIKANTDKLVVIDLKPDRTIVYVDDEEFTVNTMRIHPEFLELICQRDKDNTKSKRKKTLNFYFGDLIIMNRAMHRIVHPNKQ